MELLPKGMIPMNTLYLSVRVLGWLQGVARRSARGLPILLLAAATPGVVGAEEVQWRTDYQAARKEARAAANGSSGGHAGARFATAGASRDPVAAQRGRVKQAAGRLSRAC